MKIGMVGLGIMGKPMANNLLNAGYDCFVWARRPDTITDLCAQGAQSVANLSDLARSADVVISMVGNADDVRTVWLGEHGLAQASKAGLIGIDMTTIDPPVAQEVAQVLAERQINFLDAPVSGGEVGAINGTLSIMVGGEAKTFAAVKPVLACMGKQITHIGDSGSGQIAKAANQILTGVGVVAVAEALNFARIMGADPERVREALLGGFAQSKILEAHGRRMLDRQFKPGFKAWMQQKDMNIVMQCAHQKGMSLPITAAASQMMNALVGMGLGEEDAISVFRVIEDLAAAHTKH